MCIFSLQIHSKKSSPHFGKQRQFNFKYILCYFNRNLERCYPQFPGEKDLLNYVQSLIIENDSLRLLVRFILERHWLELERAVNEC